MFRSEQKFSGSGTHSTEILLGVLREERVRECVLSVALWDEKHSGSGFPRIGLERRCAV
jgi:hypothetical protein